MTDEHDAAEAAHGTALGLHAEAERQRKRANRLHVALQVIAARPCSTPKLCTGAHSALFCTVGIARYALDKDDR